MSFESAVAVNPDHTEALNNRGASLYRLSRYEEALACHERVLTIDPDDPHAFGGAADCALTICDWTRTARFGAELPGRIASQAPIVAPFRLLGYSGDPALQRRGAELYVRRNVQGVATLGPARRIGAERIRIGYLSAQFMAHAGASLIAELIEVHDRSRFEPIGFALCPDDDSDLRRRLATAFDAFHDLCPMNDGQAAEFVRDLEVDILVDLTGHSRGARLGILARRPAPVQVSWLGHAGTMGAPFIDYVIADPVIVPTGDETHFVEKIAWLPDCYLVTDTTRRVPAEVPSRSAAGLPDAAFVFCCFNNNYKITAPVFDRWMRLLGAIDGSVLWLLRDNDAAERNLQREAAARGIDPARLIFAPRVSAELHLARHALADLFLDTLPFNAHVTASDALWAGLPVLTCRGEAFAGRVAASLLQAAGLPEMVAPDLDAYQGLALRLARSPAELGRLRRHLHDARCACPLFDTTRFRRHLEAAYQTMWNIAQGGDSSQSFAIDAEVSG